MKTDIRPVATKLYFIPVKMRIPLKFGFETCTEAVCLRVCMTVENRQGQRAVGWGETPLAVTWVWPGKMEYQQRCEVMQLFSKMLAQAWAEFDELGHPIEVGSAFINSVLPEVLKKIDLSRGNEAEPMPWLAGLVCCSAFDIALHDAYGQMLGRDVYSTYNAEFMNSDLSQFIIPADDTDISFKGRYPAAFINYPAAKTLWAWHLVGGNDLLDKSELTGSEPDDGFPVLLPDWIKRDGLKCLKVKLLGNDPEWDYQRLVKIGKIAIDNDVCWLTSDFNCTVSEPAYVNEILDKLMADYPRIYQMILYVEQPFPYDLEKNRIDVHSVSARKPLFMDESAHDWKLVRLGRNLGWTGVALKTCKTQTGAILTLCWAKAHGMTLMVQDLTNPMLSQIPHLRLAAHAGTIMGVETNAMQFYPAASEPEEAVHPGLYKRRQGRVDLSSLSGPGFGYRINEIKRELPEAAACFGK